LKCGPWRKLLRRWAPHTIELW